MRNMSYKIINHFKACSVTLIALLVVGCSSQPKKEFIPPAFPPPPEEPRFIYERSIRSSSDVEELSASDKLKIFATGTAETAFGLGKPYGVAVQKGRIFVTDTAQRAIMVFDVPAAKYEYYGTEGLGTLAKPLGIDIAANGDIYVVDGTQQRVVVFDATGKYLRTFGGRAVLARPSGIALSPDGKKAYVVDTGGIDIQEHSMYVFDSESGELLQTIGTRGTEEGNFNLPLQVATDNEGSVFVVDGGNFRVQKFSADGKFLYTVGEAGRRSGQFSRPKGVSTDKDGNFYVVDAAFGNFQIFNKEGQLLLFVGNRGNSGGPAEFMLPAGIDVDEDGRVYMIDQFFRKLDVFRPAKLSVEDGYLGTRYRDEYQDKKK